MPWITFTERQSKLTNCGAYALAAVAQAFGKLPSNKDIQLNYGSRKSAISAGKMGAEAADLIYEITGEPNQNGDSLPSALSYVAKQLGLVVDVMITQSGFASLNPLYPGEIDRCKAQANLVNVSANNYYAPDVNEAHLICVATSGPLHWLARGKDGLYYDPAIGKDNNLWNSPNFTGDRIGSDYRCRVNASETRRKRV